MMGSLDPLGMPLATDVLSGERADDGLYLALMERLRPSVKTTGLLFVGDCKMSALATRASIAGHHDVYLSPLPLTGATAAAMEAWISEGVARGETDELARLFRTNGHGHEVLAAEGYECERTCCAKGSHAGWTERVMVVRSPLHANQQAVGLDTRLRHAETALAALTPPRGRGRRQITEEATLVEAIALVLKAHRVEGLLSVVWEKQVEQHTRYLGRGRGSASRPKRVIEHTRPCSRG
jgi:transposase